jgi:hypothetical protein
MTGKAEGECAKPAFSPCSSVVDYTGRAWFILVNKIKERNKEETRDERKV